MRWIARIARTNIPQLSRPDGLTDAFAVGREPYMVGLGQTTSQPGARRIWGCRIAFGLSCGSSFWLLGSSALRMIYSFDAARPVFAGRDSLG